MKQQKEKKIHRHTWQFVHTQYEYPMGTTGTAMASLWAYLLCQCGTVRRTIVKQ